jgi:hypothetical protein
MKKNQSQALKIKATTVRLIAFQSFDPRQHHAPMRGLFLASDQHGRHHPCIEHMRPRPGVIIQFLEEQPFFGAPERAISNVLMNFPGCEIDIIKLVIDSVSFDWALKMRFPKKTRFP